MSSRIMHDLGLPTGPLGQAARLIVAMLDGDLQFDTATRLAFSIGVLAYLSSGYLTSLAGYYAVWRAVLTYPCICQLGIRCL